MKNVFIFHCNAIYFVLPSVEKIINYFKIAFLKFCWMFLFFIYFVFSLNFLLKYLSLLLWIVEIIFSKCDLYWNFTWNLLINNFNLIIDLNIFIAKKDVSKFFINWKLCNRYNVTMIFVLNSSWIDEATSIFKLSNVVNLSIQFRPTIII